MNLNGSACKQERETVSLRQFTWRCTPIIESTLVQQKKITLLGCTNNFVFGSTERANNGITCHGFCWSVLFTVVLWNVIFFGFSKTCKVIKSDDLQKKFTLKKKQTILTSEAPLPFFVKNYKPKVQLDFFCYVLFIYKTTPTLLLHMNRNQMTFMHHNVMDFNFYVPLTPLSVANML